ncbi:MAG: phytoene desaturase family protein [Burkholderiales bacterium]
MKRVVVVGSGVGGLVTALLLAARGVEVVLVEKARCPGGKMREAKVDGAGIDAGPTVLTMRWVFEEIFDAVGASFADAVSLRPLGILARHAWSSGSTLDLHADAARSADAIGRWAGAAEAQRFLAFCAHARRVYTALETPFLRAPAGSVFSLVRRSGWSGLPQLMSISPFVTLDEALARHFRDPRLRQLFARYATYCGSSPFDAPATLMLVAHVEQDGVWSVEGGMQRRAEALAQAAERRGASLRFGDAVDEVDVDGAGAAGVRLASGERIEARAVVVNADAQAVARGLLGAPAARAVDRTPDAARSLSAVTWAMRARPEGVPLTRHNVFFSDDYRSEFDDIFVRGVVPRTPTVYVCAQDRLDDESSAGAEDDRLLCLVNAPANGDRAPMEEREIEACLMRARATMARCNLTLHEGTQSVVTTAPADFARMFPGTGGALYGRATHGWQASFARPGSRTRIPRLYLAGGSTHPGPGVPMAALSGRLAAASVLEDLASMRT